PLHHSPLILYTPTPPLGSILFPYTTLFRSTLQILQEGMLALAAPSANVSGKPSPTTADHVLQDLDGKIAAVVDDGTTEVGIESTDRKSTRLNSSHVSISYAVFCLKKKNDEH